MVKILAGITGLTLMIAGVFGFAAPLTVIATNLQAGGDTVVTCDSEVQVTWNVQWTNTIDEYVVHNVFVNGIDDTCIGSDVVITLTTLGGNFLAQGTINDIAATSPSPAFNFNGSVQVDQVYDVHVAIINGPSD